MESLTEVQQQLFDWLVDYIKENQHSPSIRQMMRAMGLKSPAPIQSRLEHLRAKGYIDWTEGRARTIRILKPQGLPILGAIAAGSVVESYTDSVEQLDFSCSLLKPGDYALRVRGDSMIGALIGEGDVVIMRPVQDPKALKNGAIVAARVNGDGTTLKYYHRKGNQVTLKPANPNYNVIEAAATDVAVQGLLVAVWRGYSHLAS
ncbi:transcriptional repressor LexA [Leptolyngbya sp. FACHB-711]|uniref:transcriptional repressor LexA n=1 Tax=unclassified Leptolyngbya TaxID=2650499 RepID=UPI001689C063|nr:transcriptional repressor LexA [Leptolyngbya sp. FACHB-711]MBD1849690.1 repressor LexA [Cyanobacteria bacterium FACHB-502]MBD2023691.1 repressor LexA [Leptolyngbya sp. FACHB-711]